MSNKASEIRGGINEKCLKIRVVHCRKILGHSYQ